MKRVQVLMSPACHRILKQVACKDGVTMSEFMYQCARAHIHKRAHEDIHLLAILKSEGITPDN